MKIYQIIIVLSFFVLSCKESNKKFEIPQGLPEFDAELILNDRPFVFISLVDSTKDYIVYADNREVTLDSIMNNVEFNEAYSPSVLLFIDKNINMNYVFDLEHDLRLHGVLSVYYVSKKSNINNEISYRGIERKLLMSNQAGTEFVNYYNYPPPPQIKDAIERYPYSLIELNNNGYWLEGMNISNNDLKGIIEEEVSRNSKFLLLHHIDSDISYNDFTTFLSIQNNTYIELRDILSKELYGQSFEELEEEKRKEIKQQIPIRALRINDKELKIIKTASKN